VERVSGLDMSGFASVKEGNNSVAISTDISMELEAEGFAREIVHRVQTMRRTAGYEIADHIILYYEGSAHFVQSISAFADYIRQETLADDIEEEIPEDADARETFKLGGANLKMGVKKAK
jgi:isoleucyl-tRNA synthetase